MKKQKKYTNKELAQAHVLPHGLTEKQKEEADKHIWEMRKKSLEKLDSDKILLSQMMRLKFKMSRYIASNNYDEIYTFSYFLKEYVSSLNMTKHAFSKEISLHNSQLSRLLPVSYTHLRAHETVLDLVCRLLLETKKQKKKHNIYILLS